MKTVFDPEILFISESDWQDSEKREAFLAHLLDNLKYIYEYQITKIYWTDDLEELLWNYPQLPPWRQDRDCKIPLVPIIYRYLNFEIKEYISTHKKLGLCIMEPFFYCSCFEGLALCSFLELMHIVISRSENVYFCLGFNRVKEEFSLFCNCHSFQLSPRVISQASEWLDYINLTDKYWPKNANEGDKFNKALEIQFKKWGKQPLLEYEFSKSFLKDIAAEQNHRTSIIEWMAKRLILSLQQAARDPYLQDELVEKKKERRFRVTQRPFSTRIHYKYVNKKIIFLRYYGEGKHDDGL